MIYTLYNNTYITDIILVPEEITEATPVEWLVEEPLFRRSLERLTWLEEGSETEIKFDPDDVSHWAKLPDIFYSAYYRVTAQDEDSFMSDTDVEDEAPDESK